MSVATVFAKILNGDYGTYSITDDYRDIYSIKQCRNVRKVVMALAMEVGQVNTVGCVTCLSCLTIVGITLEVHTARADGIVYAWHLHGIILEMYSRMVVLTILRAFLPTTVIS